MKFLIVGLGNIGKEYAHTRHNIGFDVLDAFLEGKEAAFTNDRYADKAEIKYRGKKVILIKPTTYMNLSGKAVNYWMQDEKILMDHVLIILDDVALPFGALRLRSGGNNGGHNGLKNIDELLGSNNYPRLRFGIGNDFLRGQQVDYVLGKWSEDQMKVLPDRIKASVDVIKSFVGNGITFAMNNFNNK